MGGRMSLKGGIPKTLSQLQKDVADADVIQRADVFADGRSQLRLFAGKADGLNCNCLCCSFVIDLSKC